MGHRSDRQRHGAVANARGYIYEQEYTEDTTVGNAFTFDAKAIAELGLSGSDMKTESQMTDYKYWNGNGMVDREGCPSAS